MLSAITAMVQSLTYVTVHFIFSTKNRINYIIEPVRPGMYECITTIAKNLGSHVHEIGGVADHVHILTSLPPELSYSTLVSKIKSNSSRWLKTQGRDFEFFSWQRGYAVFAVDIPGILPVSRYIKNQENHHKKVSFQDELRAILRKTGIDFDIKYLLD